jgi:hypothetical protein
MLTDDTPPLNFMEAKKKNKIKKPWKIEYRCIDERIKEVFRRGWFIFGKYETLKQRDQAISDLKNKNEHLKYEYRKVDPERKIK